MFSFFHFNKNGGREGKVKKIYHQNNINENLTRLFFLKKKNGTEREKNFHSLSSKKKIK